MEKELLENALKKFILFIVCYYDFLILENNKIERSLILRIIRIKKCRREDFDFFILILKLKFNKKKIIYKLSIVN